MLRRPPKSGKISDTHSAFCRCSASLPHTSGDRRGTIRISLEPGNSAAYSSGDRRGTVRVSLEPGNSLGTQNERV